MNESYLILDIPMYVVDSVHVKPLAFINLLEKYF